MPTADRQALKRRSGRRLGHLVHGQQGKRGVSRSERLAGVSVQFAKGWRSVTPGLSRPMTG